MWFIQYLVRDEIFRPNANPGFDMRLLSFPFVIFVEIWCNIGPLSFHNTPIHENLLTYPSFEHIQLATQDIGFKEVHFEQIHDFVYDFRPEGMRSEIWNICYAIFQKP